MFERISSVGTLTKRIASGDTDAFARLYESCFDECLDEVRRMTGMDVSTCLDIVQDAMLRAAKAMPVFETREDLHRWMRRVLLNGARDRMRSELRRARRESAPRPVSETTIDADELQDLQSRLDALDTESASLIRWRFDFGWTLERIGRELGLKPGAVDGRIRRILTRMRGERD